MSYDPWRDFTPEGREWAVTRPLRYPEYSGHDAPCRKCGTHRVDTTHQAAYPPWTEVDWLDRKCCTCGFKWVERCVNPERVIRDDREDLPAP